MPPDNLTMEDYLASLDHDRRVSIEGVRQVILNHLPAGYVEAVTSGMITYDVPLKLYPNTYNGKPLTYVALASQKNYMSLYLMGIYASPELRTAFEKEYRGTGKRYDVGKSCVRFRRADDLPLDLIGRTIGAMDVNAYVSLTKAAKQAGTSRGGG